ncbi:hypothetical protein HFP15_15205 [Amycolatopsis sp. K13G38]|uniref:peptidylprolyl isomerase n=1 Tax=Amycolatopsis acididurans TaxID=2724524 RepID=A0ABX1J7B3_9PSEU|nr:peptidyl-prolyl cis-trans isomerase [Amycolatopsis acididurans]NKQ54235.1 hypothetical protein [Amycolatopsis acididurans]
MKSWLPLLAPRGRARWAGLVVGLLVLAGASTQIGIAWATALPAGAVLRYGGTTISQDQFRHRIAVLSALYGVEPPADGPEADRFNRDAAKSTTVSLVLDQAARDKNVVIADKNAQDVLDKLISQNVTDGRAAFDQFLGTHGVSEADVLGEIKRQLATNRLMEIVTANVPKVTDADVRTAYDTHRSSMISPEKRHLRNIVVGSEAEANAMLAQLRGGADFGALAKASSLDQSTKDSGGDLGTLSADQMEDAYSKAAFAAPAGGLFGPVQTRYGWNVGQVVEVQQGQPLSFDQAKDQLRTDLQNQRTLDAWRAWLADQLKAANVEYADAYRPADPDAPPADASH